MDIISKLPLEVTQHIFSLLHVADLGRCLRVSKHWRKIANDNILWKYHCENYGINDDECKKDCSSDLCYWSLIWNTFSKTQAYKWHLNSYRNIELSKNDYKSFTSHEAIIAVFSKTFNNLDVYTIKKNTNRALLLVSLALCFPKDNGIPDLSMDSNYIIVLKYNVLLLFKRNGNTYELTRAYAVISNTLIHADRDFSSFVNYHIDFGAFILIDGFSNNIILFSDFEGGSFVININTNHMTNVVTYESTCLQGDMLITYSEVSVLLYNIGGANEILIDNLDGVGEVSANNTLVALARGFHTEFDYCLVEVYDLESSEPILKKEMSRYTWIKLHPKEETLFTLGPSLDKTVFRITSWCARTGSHWWIFESNNFSFFSFWEARVVCDKYLVLWPTESDSKTFYLFDSITGKFIYEESRPGLSNHVSDYLWISQSENESLITIRSYV